MVKNDDQKLYHIEIQGKDAFEHFEKDKKFRDDYVIVETFPEEETFSVVTGNLNLLPATQKSFFHEATTLSELRRVLRTHKKLSQQMDDVELSITVIGKTLIKDALLERDIFNDNNYHVFDPFEDEESGELVLNVTKKQAQGTLIERIDEDEKLDVSLGEMLQEMDQEKENLYEEIEKKIEEHRKEDPTINLLFTKFEQEIEKETELELERARELHTNASEGINQG